MFKKTLNPRNPVKPRVDRLAQLSHVEQVIQQKKREIQERIKHDSTAKVSSSDESSSSNPSETPSNLAKNKINFSNQAKSFKSGTTNMFSNDGSFLDQFLKSNSNVKKPTAMKINIKSNISSMDKFKSASKLDKQEEKFAETSDDIDEPKDIKVEPDSEPKSTEYANDDNNFVGLPVSTCSPPPKIAASTLSMRSATPTNASVLKPTAHFSVPPPKIPHEQHKPFDVTTPSKNNATTSFPWGFNASIPPPFVPTNPNNSNSKLAAIPSLLATPIAPPTKTPVADDVSGSSAQFKKNSSASSIQIHSSPVPLMSIPTANLLPTSNQTSQQTLQTQGTPGYQAMINVARIVAQCGPSFEDTARERKQHDPNMWFLYNPQSVAYKQFKEMVSKFVSEFEQTKSHATEKLDSDEMNEKPTFAERDNNARRGHDNFDKKNTRKKSRFDATNDDDYYRAHAYRGDDYDSQADTKYDPEEALNNKYEVEAKFEYKRDERSKRDRSSDSDSDREESEKQKRRRKRKSRWGDKAEVSVTAPGVVSPVAQTPFSTFTGGVNIIQPLPTTSGNKTPMLSKVTRQDPALQAYAKNAFGTLNLSEEEWKKAEDHYKINLLYQDIQRKRNEIEKLQRAGKFKYEYDSDEDVEGGTWEHKLRQQEMEATRIWADELTLKAGGRHHIGDFLPPEELKKFLEKSSAAKEGREPNLSDYKEYKLSAENKGFQLLQKMGWNEGQGLGSNNTGIIEPVNKAAQRDSNQGLGTLETAKVTEDDDEYDAYRKRMMIAYRFRPNPLNNPRRPYY